MIANETGGKFLVRTESKVLVERTTHITEAQLVIDDIAARSLATN